MRHINAALAIAVLLMAHVCDVGGTDPLEVARKMGDLAARLRQRHMHAKAEAKYLEALQLVPGFTRLRFELGNMLLHIGDYGGAVEQLEIAAGQEPGVAETWVSLGIGLLQVRRLSDAAESFRTALSIKRVRMQRRIQITELRGTAFLEMHAYDKSLTTFRGLLDILGARNVSVAKLRKKKKEQAEQVRRGFMGVAKSHQGLRDREGAVKWFTKACDIRGDFDCHDALGQELASLGKLDEAESQWIMALGYQRRLKDSYGPEAPRLEPDPRRTGRTLVTTPLPEAGGSSSGEGVVHQLAEGPGPRVYVADSFISADHAAGVRELYEARHSHVHSAPPLVCFSRTAPYTWLVENTVIDHPEAAVLATLGGPKGREKEQICFDSGAAPVISANLSWSTSTFVYRGESTLIDEVTAKLEAEFGLPQKQALATQLLKYEGGQEYLEHTDCSLSLQANQRAVTALVYLSATGEGESGGGATEFPQLGVQVAPKVGRLVIFTGLTGNGFCDPRSAHIGGLVDGETKYVIQQWYLTTDVPSSDTRPGDKMRPYLLKGQPYVLCDRSRSCREYFAFDSNRKAEEYRKPGSSLGPGVKAGLKARTKRVAEEEDARARKKRRRAREFARKAGMDTGNDMDALAKKLGLGGKGKGKGKGKRKRAGTRKSGKQAEDGRIRPTASE